MKTYLIASLLIAVLLTPVVAQEFTAPVAPRQQQHRPPPQVAPRTTVGGVIPRAFRGGNPLQILNPRASRKYGTSQDVVTYDPDDPGKITGIKLFEIRF